MNYARIYPTFWTGETGRFLRGHPEAQLVGLYLVTNAHANMIGLYHITLPTIAAETGLSVQGVRKGLGRLSEGTVASYDEHTEHVWVHEMPGFQLLNGRSALETTDNRVKACRRLFEGLASNPYLQPFFERYGSILRLERPHPKACRDHVEVPSEPLRRDPAVVVATAVAECSKGGVGGNGRLSPPIVAQGFDALWTVYPRKQAKKAARKAYEQLAPDEALQHRIRADVASRKARDPQWREGIVPHLATYLRGERWEDEVGARPTKTEQRQRERHAGIAAFVAGGGGE